MIGITPDMMHEDDTPLFRDMMIYFAAMLNFTEWLRGDDELPPAESNAE